MTMPDRATEPLFDSDELEHVLFFLGTALQYLPSNHPERFTLECLISDVEDTMADG
jgi:hypothetical protein